MISKIKRGIRLLLVGGSTLLASVSAVAAQPALVPTVVIDAGHGGHDVGATDNGVREKDVNLAVAQELSELVKKKLKGVKVVMTRDDDTFVSLQERANIANRNHGNLFISIHTNSVDKSNPNRKSVKGSSVYALGLNKDANNLQVARKENSVIELESDYQQKYSGFDPQKDESYIIFEMAQKRNLGKSLKFADAAQKELVSVAGRADRGVKQAGFWVLWATSMPAVLVELDFICNPESACYISSKEGQKQMAKALFNAVEDYFESSAGTGKGTKNSSVTQKPVKVDSQNSKESNKEKNSSQDKKKNKKKDKKNKNSRKDTASTEATAVSAGEDLLADSDPGVAVLPAARPTSAKKVESTNKSTPESRGRSYSYAEVRGREGSVGKRRRRSASSARQSDARTVETDAIVLGSESEWLAMSGDSEASVEAAERVTEPEAVEKNKSKKDKKKSKKKESRQNSSRKRLVLTASGEVKTVVGDDADSGKGLALKTHKSTSGHRPNTARPVKVYKIQLLASEQRLNENNPRFHGLKPVRTFRENNLYKYTYGESKDRAEMEKLLRDVKKDIPDAFIISTKK